jgi:hypothetical protein
MVPSVVCYDYCYWVSGLCAVSFIRNRICITFLKLDQFPYSGEKVRCSDSVGSVRRPNLDHLTGPIIILQYHVCGEIGFCLQ